MKLSRILEEVDYIEVHNFTDREIEHVTSDSREKFKNSLFIAVKGFENDGSKFVEDALSSGAIAVIHESGIIKMSDKITYIRVSDSRQIQSKVASAVYGRPADKLNLTGVTGTNGKTSFSYIYRHILKNSGIKCCMLGTTEYDLGKRIFIPSRTTPDAVFLQRYFKEMIDSGCKNAVIEVSSHALSLFRVEEVFFNTAVFTNLTQDHLDFHGNMEEYSRAKALLFGKHIKKGGTAVINSDDEYSDMIKKSTTAAIRTYSELSVDSDIYIRNIEHILNGMRINYKFNNEPLIIETNLNGKFQAYNIAAAVLSASLAGLKPGEISEALKQPVIIPGRMEKVFDGEFSVIVDYAHTPDALERALKTIREYKAGRLITVMGCGGNRDHDKRPKMGNIASTYSDLVVITDDNPRYEQSDLIIENIEKGIIRTNYEIISDRKKAIGFALNSAKPGDIVLITGKGHENYQEIAGVKYPFSDQETVRNILGTI